MLSFVRSFTKLKVVDRVYAVNRGGRNHIDAILWLCREAIKKSQDVSYFSYENIHKIL